MASPSPSPAPSITFCEVRILGLVGEISRDPADAVVQKVLVRLRNQKGEPVRITVNAPAGIAVQSGEAVRLRGELTSNGTVDCTGPGGEFIPVGFLRIEPVTQSGTALAGSSAPTDTTSAKQIQTPQPPSEQAPVSPPAATKPAPQTSAQVVTLKPPAPRPTTAVPPAPTAKPVTVPPIPGLGAPAGLSTGRPLPPPPRPAVPRPAPPPRPPVPSQGSSAMSAMKQRQAQLEQQAPEEDTSGDPATASVPEATVQTMTPPPNRPRPDELDQEIPF